MSIYTRTGDTGTTSLFGGKRVLKCEELVDAYGSIDELNSWVGLIVADKLSVEHKDFFIKVQSDLLLIGSCLAGWPADLDTLETRVTEMEIEIDVLEKKLPKLTNFILPGGTVFSARLHLARSVCRRVERQAVALKVQKVRQVRKVREANFDLIIKYLNRLSDLFFMLARFINKQVNVKEIVWSGLDRSKVNKKK